MLDAVTERAVPTESLVVISPGCRFRWTLGPWRTRHPDGVVIPQDRLEEILEDHLREMGVAVCRGAELTGLTCNEAGVEGTVSGPGGERAVRAAMSWPATVRTARFGS